MAAKKKRSKNPPPKTKLKKKKPPPKKLVSLPRRNTERRKIDPANGKEISRRQYEKLYGRKKKTPNARAVYRHKFQLYLAVRNDYIEKAKAEGKKISKREAMNSAELKKIIRGLHSKDPIVKAAALAKTGRITPDQIELYAQKFADED